MSNRVDEQRYIDNAMRRLPDVKNKRTHVIKSGENLWTLAKKELNNPKATNKEISEYMLLIAKANNFTTIEKMNNIKINQEIFIPEIQNKNVQNPTKTNQAKAQVPDTPAEKAFFEKLNILKNDKTVRVEKSDVLFGNLYHVYHSYEDKKINYKSDHRPVMSFTLDENNKVQNVSFEGANNIYEYGYDYNMNKKGVISKNGDIYKKVLGQINPAEMEEFTQVLEQKMQGVPKGNFRRF